MNLLRVVVLAVAVVSALPGSGAPLFRKPLPIDIGAALGDDAGPLVSADFNHDGFPDVAAMHLDGRLAVALNNGTGPFAPTRFTVTGVQDAVAMAAGDIDGDGDADLVYASEGTFGTLIGNGDGTFTAGISLVSSGGFVGLGDFNGDGKLDGVTASDDERDPPALSVHAGNGAGGFAAAVTMAIPQTATGLAVARLDGNALDDVIVTSVVATRVWTAQAGGGMQLVATLFGGVALTTGRFDADTNTDLAIVDVDNRAAWMVVLTGNGDGTFTSRATYSLPEDGPIVCTDIDADGFNDLVTSSAVLTVFRGLGTGAFDAPQLSPITPDSQLAVADFDRDGHADLVTLQAYPPALEFVKGGGGATFGPDRMYVLRTPPVLDDDAEGAAVDVDNDGHPDVVTLVDNGTTRALAVLRNDGSGRFLAPVLTPAAISASAESTMVVGRVDGDAYPDAVVVGNETGAGVRAITFLGGAGGTFTRGPSVSVPFPDDVPRPRLADVTGDGAADLLIDSVLLAGNGSGAFAAPLVRPVTCNVVADFNGDGKRDLVGLNSDVQMAIALNSGGGNFGTPVVLDTGFGESAYVAADFNGDGKTDLFSMSNWPKTRVRLGHGDGTFDAPLEVIVPYFADEHEVKAADFDGDGKLDVSFSSVVLLGNGDGRFRALEVGSLTLDQSGVADFDGNGTLDLCTFGDVVAVRLAGLVPEPTRDAATTLTAPATAAYAETVLLGGRTTGTVVPVTGAMTIAIDGAPYVIWGVWPDAATSPATAAGLGWSDVLAVGTHTLSVTYSGDQTWRSSTASRQVEVDRATTSLTVTKWTGTAYGDDIVYSVPLTAPELSGSPGPTGQRVVRKGATALNATWTDDRVAIRGLDAGTHLLTFEYPGDANYKPFTKDVSLTLAKRDPSPQWTLPAGQPTAGPITVKATFNPGVYGAATGTATLTFEGQAPRGVTVTNGSAEATVTMPAGTWVVTVDYPGDANYLPISATREVVVYGGAFGAPIALSATVRNGVADVQWTPLTGVARYDLYRRSTFDASWELVTNTTRARINANITANTTREWSVIPRSTNNNNAGARSASDLATNVTFTDDPAAVTTRIRAVQLNELRTAVNALRTFAKLAPFTFTDSLSAGFSVKALHLTQLRTALSEARSAIGKPVTYAESVAAGTRSKATHLEEIRNGVR